MSAGSPTYSDRSLLDSIRPFRNRVIGFDLGKLALFCAGALVLSLLIAMWLDTVWALPAEVRWFTTRVGWLLAAAVLALAVWRRRTETTHERIADRIDNAIGSGGEVLAGWQLTTRPVQPSGELSQGFAAMASQRAVERVQSLTPDIVVSWNVLKTAAIFFSIIFAIAIGLGILVPGISWHQMQRFLYPSSDIPPYTGIVLELELEKQSVLYGQDTYATARVAVGKVDRLSLVVRTDSGQEQIMPMLAQNENQWHAILTRVTEPLTVFARSRDSRSRFHRLDVTMTPKIMPPKITVTPPAYTRSSVYRGVLPEQGLVGLAGTKVEWEVTSNRPLATGHLLISYRNGTSEQIEFKRLENSDKENTVIGEIQLSRAGQFELSVVDVDGVESQDRISGLITITEDRRPIVRIVQPQQTSLATPDIKLPVTVTAEDDYGITSLSLFRSLNGSPSTPVAAEVDGTARVQQQWLLPLQDFGLIPGDQIQLFARTEDNDPAGAKGAESPVTTIHIISVEQFQEMMVQRRGAESIQAKYQAARRYFDQLANALREVEEAEAALEKDPESAEAAKQLQEKLEAAKQAAEQASQEISKLSKQPMPIDVDRELAKTLAEMSEQASKMAEELGEIQKNAQPSLEEQDEEKIAEMLEQSRGAQKKLTEQAIDPLKKMQQMLPLVVDQQRFAQITGQQRDLAERLKSLKESDGDDSATHRRIAELEGEQEQLHRELSQLLDDIESHAEALPEDPDTDTLKQTALEFVDAVRDSDAQSEMSSAQKNLLDDHFQSAQQNAQSAAEILESFLSKCEGMVGQACENCKAAFRPSAGGPKLGNSIQQMLAMMGMKPGKSGMKPGGSPGMGMGFGAGGGYAQRSPGPENVGMYGSLPMAETTPSRGQGDRQSQGFQTSRAIDATADGAGDGSTHHTGDATGQGMNLVPANYRSRVDEYFRNLSNIMGNSESEKGDR